PLVIAVPVAPEPPCARAAVQLRNQSNLGATWLWTFADGDSSTAQAPTHTYAAPGTYTVTSTAINPEACNGQDSASIQVTVLPAAPLLQPLDPISICGTTDNLLLVGDALGTATLWLWSSDPLFSDTLNTAPDDSTATLAPVVAGTYYVQASNPGGCTATGEVTVSSSLAQAGISPDVSICADDTVA